MRISFGKSVTESLLAKIRSGEMMSRSEKFNLIIQLSIPSILAQGDDSLMFYIDAGMVGSLGAEPSAAIGLVEPATWLFLLFSECSDNGFFSSGSSLLLVLTTLQRRVR